MKTKKKFYIGERHNPQLSLYYRAYGQLGKRDAKNKTKSLYGSMELIEFDNESDYLQKIETLEKEGFSVYK